VPPPEAIKDLGSGGRPSSPAKLVGEFVGRSSERMVSVLRLLRDMFRILVIRWQADPDRRERQRPRTGSGAAA